MKHIMNGCAGFVLRNFILLAGLVILLLFLRVYFPDIDLFSILGIGLLTILVISAIWEIYISKSTSDDRIESKGKIIYDEKRKPRWRH